VPVIASGGVANLEDIVSIQKTNTIKGVIVGKAIYDGSINLEELVKII
jgi:phosphoribosylformimino-5-aminoimidazole carboxamide ribotide isomerase